MADVDGPAVVALAASSAGTLTTGDAGRHLAAIAAELGLPPPDRPAAASLPAADTCARILGREIPASAGVHRLYAVGHEGSPLRDLLPAVSELAGRLEDDLGGRADDDLRARPDKLAGRILTRAERMLIRAERMLIRAELILNQAGSS